MKKETTEHRQVVIAAMVAVVTTLMILMLTAQKAHAIVEVTTLGDSAISHCGYVPAAPSDYTVRERNVRIIQTKLEKLGYSVGSYGIDGKYGKYTKAATTRFQEDYNLAANGKVEAETATILAYATHAHANVRRCKTEFKGFRS